MHCVKVTAYVRYNESPLFSIFLMKSEVNSLYAQSTSSLCVPVICIILTPFPSTPHRHISQRHSGFAALPPACCLCVTLTPQQRAFILTLCATVLSPGFSVAPVSFSLRLSFVHSSAFCQSTKPPSAERIERQLILTRDAVTCSLDRKIQSER
uniref:Uncharacterized protein n=1 Tax=Oryzias latipes TaxID=8090 RepID=A0A3B3HXC6_ORYLA